MRHQASASEEGKSGARSGNKSAVFSSTLVKGVLVSIRNEDNLELRAPIH